MATGVGRDSQSLVGAILEQFTDEYLCRSMQRWTRGERDDFQKRLARIKLLKECIKMPNPTEANYQETEEAVAQLVSEHLQRPVTITDKDDGQPRLFFSDSKKLDMNVIVEYDKKNHSYQLVTGKGSIRKINKKLKAKNKKNTSSTPNTVISNEKPEIEQLMIGASDALSGPVPFADEIHKVLKKCFPNKSKNMCRKEAEACYVHLNRNSQRLYQKKATEYVRDMLCRYEFYKLPRGNEKKDVELRQIKETERHSLHTKYKALTFDLFERLKKINKDIRMINIDGTEFELSALRTGWLYGIGLDGKSISDLNPALCIQKLRQNIAAKGIKMAGHCPPDVCARIKKLPRLAKDISILRQLDNMMRSIRPVAPEGSEIQSNHSRVAAEFAALYLTLHIVLFKKN